MAPEHSDSSPTFRTRLFGYDKEQVRQCLQNVASEHAEAVQRIAWLTAELKSQEAADKETLRREIAATQIADVLASAHRIAEDVRVEAEKAADRVLRDAQQEASQLRTQAEADAAALASSTARWVKELETEIQTLVERRQSMQFALDRAADRLNDIANDIRRTVKPVDAAAPPTRNESAPRADSESAGNPPAAGMPSVASVARAVSDRPV